MKPFQERSPFIIGVAGTAVIASVAAALLNFESLPFASPGNTYKAYFQELGGLTTGAAVEVSGFQSGKVTDISLDPNGVLVEFTVADDVPLGEDTEATISSNTLLGAKILQIAPRGKGALHGTIPLDRTRSPYQLPDAIGDLTATISGVNTDKLSNALATLSDTLKDTPPQLKVAVDGVARFSETLNHRDAQLRQLLSDAGKATTVLADRTDKIMALIKDSNAVLVALRSQSAALDEISGNISALAQQLHGFIGENRSTLKPALDKLNGVLATLDNRKAEIQEGIKGLDSYVMSFGEVLSGGPFFKAYISNLIPGQFMQPFIDSAFSDLGLDPNVLAPSKRTDPQVGQPGTPPLPIPYPRTGQGGNPNLNLPDAITGNPGDQGCGPAGLPLPGPTHCYPYREPLPAPPPGGPPPGPPARLPSEPDASTPPTPSAVFQPAPGEPAPTQKAGR